MRVEEFIPTQQFKAIENGTVCCTAPSNIALVKYWGKKPHQIPANPSISFTLNNCKTTTILKYKVKPSKGLSFEVFLEGKPKKDLPGALGIPTLIQQRALGTDPAMF